MRKKVFIVVLLFIVSLILASCGSMSNGVTMTGYSFVDGIVDGDYGKSYDCCYFSQKEACSREDFIARYENIFSALEVVDVSLVSRNISDANEDRETYDMEYVLNLKSNLLGDINYTYDAMIMKDVSGYSVEFDPSLILPYMESGDTVRVETLHGARGEIFAQDKILLAENAFADTVYIKADEITDINTVAAKLSELTGNDIQTIIDGYNNAVEKDYDTYVIKAFNKNYLEDQNKTDLMAIRGVYIDSDAMTPIRYYPYQDSLAHVVGYSGLVSEEDIDNDHTLKAGDIIGKTGIEYEYEDLLRGRDGKKIYVKDSGGNEKYIIYEDKAQDGTDLILSIDAEEQQKAYTSLASYLEEGQSGCAIIMDYNTGAVRAAVSYPSFDPNWFSLGIDDVKWNYLNDENNLYPLYNRLTQPAYQPGSTFKVFTAVPALENNIISAEQTVELEIKNNEWIPPNDILPENEPWVYPVIKRAHETKGDYNMINAIKSSDNIFFAYVALLTGKDLFADYLSQIGIGDKVEFELPLAESQFKKEETEFTVHLLATSGYGMGEISLTPIQLASMYTCFMNNGDILNPYLIQSMAKEEDGEYRTLSETQPSVFREKIMKPETLETMKQAMRLVVTQGTAYELGMSEFDVFGKTGTATLVSSGENSREINWVIAISREPGNEKLVLVMVDSKADEGDNKFDIARELIYPDKKYYAEENRTVEEDNFNTADEAEDETTETSEEEE